MFLEAIGAIWGLQMDSRPARRPGFTDGQRACKVVAHFCSLLTCQGIVEPALCSCMLHCSNTRPYARRRCMSHGKSSGSNNECMATSITQCAQQQFCISMTRTIVTCCPMSIFLSLPVDSCKLCFSANIGMPICWNVHVQLAVCFVQHGSLYAGWSHSCGARNLGAFPAAGFRSAEPAEHASR